MSELPPVILGTPLSDDDTKRKYNALKSLECGGTELIKFSSLKYVYSLTSRLDSSATDDQNIDNIIVEARRKDGEPPTLESGIVETEALPRKGPSPSPEEPHHKIPRMLSPEAASAAPPQQSSSQMPPKTSLSDFLESAPDALAEDLRERQQACQRAASELHRVLSEIQSNFSQSRSNSSTQKATKLSSPTNISLLHNERTSANRFSRSRSVLFSEMPTIAPPSARRVAILRSLYKNGGLRAVAASHDFFGGLVDVKFEPTGRYPIILGASACELDRSENVGTGSGHTAVMYNYVTGQAVAHTAHGMHTVSEVDFLRNGSLGFTAGFDGHIFAWKVDNPTEQPERFQIVRSHKAVHIERLQASKYHDLLVCSVANISEEAKGEVLGVSFFPGRSLAESSSSAVSNQASSSFMMSYGDLEGHDSDMEGNGGDEGLRGINGNEASANSNSRNGGSIQGKFEVFRPFDSHRYACNDITFGGVGLETWVMCACKNGTMMAGDINSPGSSTGSGDKANVVFRGDSSATTVACASRTRMAVFGDENGVIRVWDPRTPTIAATTHGIGEDFNCVSFNPSDTLLQCSAMNHAVYVFDVRNFNVPMRILRHDIPARKYDKGILMSRWSPSGFLFSCGEDTTLRIWDMAAGDPLLRVIRSHRSSVACVAISPDESVAVSGDDGKRLVLHTLRGGRNEGAYNAPDGNDDPDSTGYDRFAGAIGPLKLDY